VACGRLHLDDFGPEVAEYLREDVTGEESRKIEHAYTVQRSTRVADVVASLECTNQTVPRSEGATQAFVTASDFSEPTRTVATLHRHLGGSFVMASTRVAIARLRFANNR